MIIRQFIYIINIIIYINDKEKLSYKDILKFNIFYILYNLN